MMNDTNSLLPDRLQEIAEDFRLCEGREKLELLLEFSERMPPLPGRLQSSRGSMEQVHECMMPVFAHAEMKNGGMEFYGQRLNGMRAILAYLKRLAQRELDKG